MLWSCWRERLKVTTVVQALTDIVHYSACSKMLPLTNIGCTLLEFSKPSHWPCDFPWVCGASADSQSCNSPWPPVSTATKLRLPHLPLKPVPEVSKFYFHCCPAPGLPSVQAAITFSSWLHPPFSSPNPKIVQNANLMRGSISVC